MSQIGDWLALIVGETIEERKQLVKYFKDTYRLRSAVAHGGSKNISLDDRAIAMQLAKHLILAFLRKKPYWEMKTIDQLNSHITELKFR